MVRSCVQQETKVCVFLVFLPHSRISETVKRQILPDLVNFFFSPELGVGGDLKFYHGILTTVKVTIRTIYYSFFFYKAAGLYKTQLHFLKSINHL